MVNEKDAREIISLAMEAGIDVWLDGGWGVDALMGRQTRQHDDIDLFVQREDEESFIQLIKVQGFEEKPMPYTLKDHTTWEDEKGRIVDLHIFHFAEGHQIVFLGQSYPGEVFSGKGSSAASRCAASSR